MKDPKELDLRPIKISGKETHYLIDSTGKYIYNSKTKRFLNPSIDSKMTQMVTLSVDGKLYYRTIHRLVYETYVGPIKPGMTIDHINEDRNDNRSENLEQVSKSENTKRYIKNHHIESVNKKYPDHLVEEICKELKNGYYFKDIALKFDVPPRLVDSIARGYTRKSISSKYMPFPKETVTWRMTRRLPTDTLERLIKDGYSNDEITSMIDLEESKSSDEYLNTLRHKVNHKYRNYHTEEETKQVENLILIGKPNVEIYKIMGWTPSDLSEQWFIGRIRHRLQIKDFNPQGISLTDQELIIEDIINGMTNAEIEKKWNLEKTPYIVHLEARLRQQARKRLLETISTENI